jgi:hypothetical protein
LAALPLFLGYLPVLTNERRRGLQDRIGHTEVTYVREQLMPGYDGKGQREP